MKIKNPISKTSLIVIYLALIVIWYWLLNLYGLNLATRCPLTYDVFGYYVYLPAIFDYHDLYHVKYIQDMVHHHPELSGLYYAGFTLDNGNLVIKYASGSAIMYSPFYFIGKICAAISGYPQDGLSRPYQVSMIFCGFFYAFAGLFVLRKVLLNFFSDVITAFVLVAVALATNYVEYSTFTSLLTHNILFFIYACILFITIRLYKNFSYKNSMLLGLLLGIAPLIRPTEIVAIFIPLLYGVENFHGLINKVRSIRFHYKKVALIILIMGAAGSIQLVYWKIVSGHFLVYSYGDQSFDFTSPHFYYAMFSTTNGWLVYTPIMFFALIGIYFCFRQIKLLFWSILIYVLFHMYFTFSWQIWWYGGSFGLRPMIQSYPVLSIALGCFVNEAFKKRYGIIVSGFALLFFIWLNIFQTYQAHEGILNISHMNDIYYLKVFGKAHISNKEYKFYDTDEELDSSHIQSSKPLYHSIFSLIDSSFIESNPDLSKKNEPCLLVNSTKRLMVLKNNLNTLNIVPGNWVTVSFDAYMKNTIYNTDQMSFIEILVKDSKQVVKKRVMRIPNKIGNNASDNFNVYGHEGIWDRLTFDFMIPENSERTDSLVISFCNPDGQAIYLNNIQVFCIKTK
jgi:hypothetical protein